MTKAEAAVAVAEAAAVIAQAIPEHCRPVRKGGWHRAPPALGGCLVGVGGRRWATCPGTPGRLHTGRHDLCHVVAI